MVERATAGGSCMSTVGMSTVWEAFGVWACCALSCKVASTAAHHTCGVRDREASRLAARHVPGWEEETSLGGALPRRHFGTPARHQRPATSPHGRHNYLVVVSYLVLLGLVDGAAGAFAYAREAARKAAVSYETFAG